jgi:hypothetical protein
MVASHLLPQETSWTWHQIYKAMQVNTRSAALALRLLGQCLLSSPGSSPSPTTLLYLLTWPSWSLLTLPLSSIDFPCGPLSLPPPHWGYVAGCFQLVAQSASHLLMLVPCSRIFLPWRWRRHVPPKHWFTQDLHGATFQKAAFFILKLLLNIVTTRTEVLVVQGNKFLYACVKDVCRLWAQPCFVLRNTKNCVGPFRTKGMECWQCASAYSYLHSSTAEHFNWELFDHPP